MISGGLVCNTKKEMPFMALGKRSLRRIAGLLTARLPELQLEHVQDPRSLRGRRWKHLEVLLRAVILAIAGRRQSCKEAEALTDDLSLTVRRQLGIRRRIPDTTLRTTLCAVEPDALRFSLWAQIRAAYRRHALKPDRLPFGVVAIDGKSTAIETWDDHYAQRKTHSQGQGVYGLVRTLTATLTSSAAKVCLDACPIPSATNEMGHFPHALGDLMKAYRTLHLFQVITTDAGMCSLANANLVVDTYHLDYLFRLKADQPTLFDEAKRHLGRKRPEHALAKTEDVVGKYLVVRYLFLTEDMAALLDWKHLKTALRIHVEKRLLETNSIVETEDHYAISSLARESLTDGQWLHLFRNHWAVENQCHNTWDKIFREDERPWIKAGTLPAKAKGSAPQGTVVVMLLRRMAYNLLALYRAVTLRSEEKRWTPWKEITGHIYATLISATPSIFEGLRQRIVWAHVVD